MEALRFTSKIKKLELVNVPIPKITQPNQVLIKVAYSGICGTDLHIIGGEFPCNDAETFTLGHEFSGTVVETGASVNTFKKGDKVSVDPNSGCLCCDHCHSGNPHYCSIGGISNTIGIFRNGGWANYCVAPVDQVHKLSDSITLEQAALAEPLSCLAHGWDIISPVTVGQKILITGAGIIGNLWVCNLHLQGHKNVTVSEPNLARLDMIKKLNTGYNLITPDQLKKNQQADPNYLFDLVIDCSGYAPAVEHAISLLRRGGKLCIFGVAPPHAEIKIKPFEIYMKELKIYGVLVNPFSFPKSLGLLEAMGDRYLNYEKIGIKTFALKDYDEAITLLKKGTIAKAVFKL
ncbi:D-altritol 5-dehydrogenase [Diabrotica virgifera virgifera]|uniref:D-arabinitol dehydrogenase 1-like n=1 Tax=Diabrotica virgifera virgifera TaxID=50390 RepID=A0A6P7F212_DIAVI|nr:D-altritol 5-dehydrogenase [Diabrotica virgifera virgifera]